MTRIDTLRFAGEQQTRELLDSLSHDTASLTHLCFTILRGGKDTEAALSTAAIKLHLSIGKIRLLTQDQDGDVLLMSAVAHRLEQALTHICSLASIIHVASDEHISCLHPVLEVGEDLNFLYAEVGKVLAAAKKIF
jgi:hypothetical protein